MTLYYACQRVISEADLNCECDLSKISPEMTEDDLNDVFDCASDNLAQISGLPVGRCEVVYRPCQDACHYWGCPCGCGQQGIPLPGLLPAVTSVTIGGVLVAADTYAVVTGPGGRKSLERFRSDGSPDSWPSQQNVALPDNHATAFTVTVETGTHPDPAMKLAVAELACDILDTIAQIRDTVDSVQTATAYGVTKSYARFGNPTDQATMNLAGLAQVRRWITTQGAVQYGAFFSNDLQRGWKLYTRE